MEEYSKNLHSIFMLLHQAESLVDQHARPHWVRTSRVVERVELVNLVVFGRSILYHAFDLRV